MKKKTSESAVQPFTAQSAFDLLSTTGIDKANAPRPHWKSKFRSLGAVSASLWASVSSLTSDIMPSQHSANTAPVAQCHSWFSFGFHSNIYALKKAPFYSADVSPSLSPPCWSFDFLRIGWFLFGTHQNPSYVLSNFPFPASSKTRLLWTVMRTQGCQFDHGKVKSSKRDLRFLCALIRSQPWSPVRSGSLLSLRPD